jgi:hypothetical protein
MKTNTKTISGIKVSTSIKGGGIGYCNHARRVRGLAVKAGIKAGEGILACNHSRRGK